ncbi:RNA polymerase sigma-70 factor, ECF subfamily [Amycolatopsis mediterranei S699]|uniref:RNA polymerase sigma-70 factor, ECF subfamily n=2 Tax=Amycolatopsis mediterranei TaxID=33910 RepID=A0A0H3CV45_AMYMU|nr:RNA polymerase sigma factor [Amycolatopsis mediterranei]ADJ41900.1 RNA polymerase sigma-70 factor, ECF subfamily [Amycolatopsis mediterranei U32]AEK38571.1 RNA polymerase sigma-70 factor, ECF subfamily protein [Amycolatopsis mediterranei S699]AFO73610.1 RNA polymerase sigma-70 factor, ECF subfamily [Amycolatopsis mediterranei S699]AGT80739.1 RNA polymerase sigma-70 factor, ECF subfamily [Amycolatopsis mediterranei RB]KDO09046.1 RNA polymerase sigma70 factor [Amycolatopsis mediterranei]
MTAAPVLDSEHFTEVHDRHFADIYRYVAGRLGAQAAEDVAAETFLVAFDRRKTFDASRGDMRAWLFGIATNLVSRHRRKEARHYRALSRLDPRETTEGHENRVVDAVVAARVGKALSRLSTGERDVLLLVALGELGYAEVAEALGISPGTVGSRLNRARKKLNPVLSQEASDE